MDNPGQHQIDGVMYGDRVSGETTEKKAPQQQQQHMATSVASSSSTTIISTDDDNASIKPTNRESINDGGQEKSASQLPPIVGGAERQERDELGLQLTCSYRAGVGREELAAEHPPDGGWRAWMQGEFLATKFLDHES